MEKSQFRIAFSVFSTHVCDKFLANAYDATRKFLHNNKEILVTAADKGNATVIMYADDYKRKMSDILSDRSTYTIINEDPTSTLMKTIVKLVNNLYKKGYIDFYTKKRMYSNNAVCPRLYGLPKRHKPGIPLRVITSACNSACYGIAKEISNVLTKIIDFEKINVKNSYEFKKSIARVKVPRGFTCVSYDVDNVFTNIPVDKAIEIIKRKWNKIKKFTKIPLTEFIELIEFCMVKNNYFRYDDVLYM